MIIVIVAPLYDGDMRLIEQANHALTSGQVARAWQKPEFFSNEVWEEFATAVAHHDKGWDLADASPLVGADGKPIDFKHYPTLEHIGIMQRSIHFAKLRGEYDQLMTVNHALWLYERMERQNDHLIPAAKEFITQLRQQRENLIDSLQKQPKYERVLEPKNFELSRKLFSFFDAISLVFVRGIDWISVADDLAVGVHVEPVRIHNEICAIRWGRMTPWPFVEDDVFFTVPTKRIPGGPYKNTADLKAALDKTQTVTRYYTLGRL